MENKADNQAIGKPDEFGVFPEEHCRFNDLLAGKLGGCPKLAKAEVCWRDEDQKPGMVVLPPMYVFGILFASLVEKLKESGVNREDIGKLYALSGRQKIDLFLSKDIPGALFDLGFSDAFIAVVCNVLVLENTVSEKVKAVTETVRVAAETVNSGTSWLSVSQVKKALIGGGAAVELVDTRSTDEDLGHADTVIASLDLDYALRGGSGG